MPSARLAVQGPRHDAVVRTLRDRPVTDRDERGLPGSRRSGLDRAVPVTRPSGREPPRLDDHALDPDLERGGRCRNLAALRPGTPGWRDLLARQGDPQDGA